MAAKDVIVLLGQSNAEGNANKLDLPVLYRGPQNASVYNVENAAIEILNVDGVGANLPNNTTFHTAGIHGLELSLCEDAFQGWGNVLLFKYGIPAASLGPNITAPEFNYHANDLYPNIVARWTALKAAVVAAGDTIRRVVVVWFQGETDALTTGTDLAYYGLFQEFKKRLRETLTVNTLEYPIRWVTCVIHQAALPVGSGHLVTSVKNVRGAQYRAGWDDLEYRIVDTDRVSYQTDLLHVDSPGHVTLGHLVWEAINLTTNNSMALEQYDLLSLRTRLAEEFGIDTTISDNARTIDRRINDAVSWIVNRRKNWPWLDRTAAIDVGERSVSIAETRYGSAVFSKAQRQAILFKYNLSEIAAREIVDFDGEGKAGILVSSLAGGTLELKNAFRGDPQIVNILSVTVGNPTIITVSLTTSANGALSIPTNTPTFGVIITGTSYATPAGTFDGNWSATRISNVSFSIPVDSTLFTAIVLGKAQIAKEFKIAQAYFEAPVDFIRNQTAHLDSDVEDNTLNYVHPSMWEREIRADRIQSSLDRVYSVVVDPLGLSSSKYVVTYPYFINRNVIHLRYWGDAKKMVADLDEPDVPRSDRWVVFVAAAWFVAQWQKDTAMAAFYRDSALQELERMAVEHQLADDTTESVPRGDDEPGMIRGPGGFPAFEEP